MDKIKELQLQLQETLQEKLQAEFLFYKLQDIVLKQESGGKSSQQEKLSLLCEEIIWLQLAKKIPDFMEQVPYKLIDKAITMEVLEDSSAYEQMVLPGLPKVKEKPNRKKKKISAKMFPGKSCFVKVQYETSVIEVLSAHDKRTLADFLKYLCIDISGSNKHSSLVENLAESICCHPLWLLPVFSESAIKRFLKLAKQPDREVIFIDEENLDDYMNLTMWGLLSIQVVDCDGVLQIGLSVPKEIEENVLPLYCQLYDEGLKGSEIATYLDPERIYKPHSLYQYYQEIDEKINGIVIMYGGIKLDTMYRMTGDILEIPWEKEEFYRFVYLFETFHRIFSSGIDQRTKERYIGINEDVLVDIFNDEDQRVTRYYSYQSYEEINQEYDKGSDLWVLIYEILEQWDIEFEELTMMIHQYRIWAFSGFSLTCILEELDEEFSLDQAMDAACLWRELIKIYLQCPCYLLKGYSRLQAEQEFGTDRFEGVFEERSCTKIAKARIYVLPIELQKQLADMVVLAEQGSCQAVMEQEKEIDKKYLGNPAVTAVLVMNLVDAYVQMPPTEQGQWEEIIKQRIKLWCKEIRETEARELMEDWCEKRGIHVNTKIAKNRKRNPDFAREDTYPYFDEDFEPILKPVVKPDKIYPNDPCPCGSGKKYKKCCGRL